MTRQEVQKMNLGRVQRPTWVSATARYPLDDPGVVVGRRLSQTPRQSRYSTRSSQQDVDIFTVALPKGNPQWCTLCTNTNMANKVGKLIFITKSCNLRFLMFKACSRDAGQTKLISPKNGVF